MKTQTVAESEFESFPWSKDDDCTILRFGNAYVVKLIVLDKYAGDKLIYRVYEPSPEKLPVVDLNKSPLEDTARLDRHLMLIDGLLHKDGGYYRQSGQELMWPKGATAAPLHNNVRLLWEKAQMLRVQEICNVVFPESVQGYLSSMAQVVHILGTKLTTWDLDDLMDAKVDLEPYLNHRIVSDMLGTGRLTKIDRKGMITVVKDLNDPTKYETITDKYMVRWRIRCMTQGCKKKITIYTMSGCHKGAFCYACNPKTGEYITDLRNNLAICEDCSVHYGYKKPKPKAVASN